MPVNVLTATEGMLATPTFEEVTSEQVSGILALFEPIVNFFMNVAKMIVDFMTANPFLMISLGIITLLAIVGFAVSLVRH